MGPVLTASIFGSQKGADINPLPVRKRELMMKIGKIGIWFWHDAMPIDESVVFAQKVEACGYGALWIPEAVGRDPFTHLAYLSSKTSSLVLATGIANIWARDAMTMAAVQKTLVEISGNRFLLGLGVSHAPLVEGLRGHRYHKPLTHMRQFLEKMAEASYKFLAPAQAVILETDPAKARAAARNYMKTYVPRLPNYKNNLLELGYTEADFADGCSDHLVDDIVAWGDLDTIKARIQAHYDSGANHVCIMPLSSEGRRPNMAAVEAFAP